jgi:rhomboid family GlyGly-CTERM serine protease
MQAFLSRFPVALWPVYLLIVMLLLSAMGDSLSLALRFDHQAIALGEYWRLLTAHVVHLGWPHTVLNGGGLLLVAWMQPKGAAWRWLLFYVLVGIGISLYLYIEGSVSNYVGASGVLHGLLIMAAFFSQWLEAWRRYLIVSAITAKLIWEQTPWYSDDGVAEVIGGYVVVDAHLLGGFAGLIVLGWVFFKKRVKFSVKT